MESKNKISIIIPTLNRINSLKRTLEYLDKGNLKPNQIIVVDQTQDANIAKEIKNVVSKYTGGVYIYSNFPSLTAARNLGLKLAVNEIIICMDDDVDVQLDTLYLIQQRFNDNSIVMIGGLNEYDNDTKNSPLSYLFFKSSFKNRYKGHASVGMYGRFPMNCGKATESMWAMGFFTIIRKSLIDKWALKWDENLKFYAYAEDLDFSYSYYKKATEEGLKCIMSTDIVVKHNVSQEYRIPATKNTYMQVAHREYLSYKHFRNPIYRLATRWANFGDFIYRLIKRQKPFDVIKAQLFLDKYRADIKKGEFHYDKFM